ncbi:hypothetical protein CFC21_062181 [Triticum aestivum]|uniref:Uncharacterized protein n=1 Tax=Triticum aestivum TaxID=4565 RepID=A0A9R1KHP7_WHEAT|nr:hypothetical protein CFC21_062181 [Triticum aestivum]
MSRPSRSDAHLSPVDEAVRVDEVRGYYDGAAPKRHSKPPAATTPPCTPTRSPAPAPTAPTPSSTSSRTWKPTPRNWCARAGRRARSSWRRSTTRTSAASASSITRLARASSRWTGPAGASFELSEDPDATERHASSKGNPATNEWIPSADTVYQEESDKPNRSDS